MSGNTAQAQRQRPDLGIMHMQQVVTPCQLSQRWCPAEPAVSQAPESKYASVAIAVLAGGKSTGDVSDVGFHACIACTSYEIGNHVLDSAN